MWVCGVDAAALCVALLLLPGEKVGWDSSDDDEASAESSDADGESSDDEVPLAKRKAAGKAK